MSSRTRETRPSRSRWEFLKFERERKGEEDDEVEGEERRSTSFLFSFYLLFPVLFCLLLSRGTSVEQHRVERR